MSDILDDFYYRKSLLSNLNCNEAKDRLIGFLDWLETTPETSVLLMELRKQADGAEILKSSGIRKPPRASNPEEIAAVGLELMMRCRGGESPQLFGHHYAITPSFQTSNVQDHFNEVMRRYIEPFIDCVERKLQKSNEKEESRALLSIRGRGTTDYPLEITESLSRFGKDHPHYERNAFIMMPFGETKAHQFIHRAIRSTLEKYGIKGHRADDKNYHDDLFPNVLTYLYGSSFGLAVFERLEADDFNPNVSLKVGYMRALGKPICLLKDQTLKTLPTDLIGKLYTPFDPQDPEGSIPESLEKWLRDKDIITL